jgi:hypothetical protein
MHDVRIRQELLHGAAVGASGIHCHSLDAWRRVLAAVSAHN